MHVTFMILISMPHLGFFPIVVGTSKYSDWCFGNGIYLTYGMLELSVYAVLILDRRTADDHTKSLSITQNLMTRVLTFVCRFFV